MLRRFVKRHFLALLGWVLHVTNRCPHVVRRKEFYELKIKLLKRWCEPNGLDLSNQSATIQMEFELTKSAYAIFPFGKCLSLTTLRQGTFRAQ